MGNVKQVEKVEKYSKIIELNPKILLILFYVSRLNITLEKQILLNCKLKKTNMLFTRNTP